MLSCYFESRCYVLLQNDDARLFNVFLPELKMTLTSKGRTNFWPEIVDGNAVIFCALSSCCLVTSYACKISNAVILHNICLKHHIFGANSSV